MYQKFVIDSDGVLRFGTVFLHRDLLGGDDFASTLAGPISAAWSASTGVGWEALRCL